MAPKPDCPFCNLAALDLLLERELVVAFGGAALARDPAAPVPDPPAEIAVETRRPVDRSHHFVVRATGDSMDGGPDPIHDGDLLLCAWLSATRPADVEGQPCLLSGYDGPVIKVPRRRDGQWVLTSWNPGVPDTPLAPDDRLEPLALVLETLPPPPTAEATS